MFRRKTDSGPASGEEENPFLLSFSDLMASLLAIFILALIVMMIQLHQQKRKLEKDQSEILVIREQYEKVIREKEALEIERERIKAVLVDLLESLNEIDEAQSRVASALDGVGLREKSLEGMLLGIQRDLQKDGIEVLVAENGTVLRIPEEALTFKLGEFSIQERYTKNADFIGASLLRSLKRDENRRLLDTVFIEGHTDSVQNRQEMGNWGLSTYRAISLWLHWTDSPGRFSELKELKTVVNEAGAKERPLISTSGYADTRPANLANSAVVRPVGIGNPADRRIDIRFTLASSEKKDLGELKEQLEAMRSKTSLLIKKLKETE
jgi:flagellar motor protein MotB